jgi:hypothetical protein
MYYLCNRLKKNNVMNKICTTIEQSKKLLELGIDVNTADMYYQYYKSFSPSDGITEGHCDIPVIGSWKEHHISIPNPVMPNADMPAWSLTALLNVIPNYKLSSEHNHHACSSETPFGKETVAWFDNPIDACYEMILKLNELNLL